jgi:hypothetical protein
VDSAEWEAFIAGMAGMLEAHGWSNALAMKEGASLMRARYQSKHAEEQAKALHEGHSLFYGNASQAWLNVISDSLPLFRSTGSA